MRKILLSILLLCLPFVAFSQGSVFKGFVVEEETSAKMENAIVAIEGTALVQQTDAEGSFVFDKNLPSGEQVVTVTKDGYDVKYFIINVVAGKNVLVNQIAISVSKSERKRREKIAKEKKKEEKALAKDREKRIEEVIKENEKKEKRLAKETKRLKKRNRDVIVTYDDQAQLSTTPVEETLSTKEEVGYNPEPKEYNSNKDVEEAITPLRIKYAELLGVTPEEIYNVPLYSFIDDWIGTPYLLGGADKDGIDCSSFAQRLFTSVNEQYIERTAQAQYDSKYTNKFKGLQFLSEGDLLFFKGVGEYSQNVSHVGVYLGNMKFINATSRRGTSGVSGVKISDLSEPFWKSIFISAGRRKNNN